MLSPVSPDRIPAGSVNLSASRKVSGLRWYIVALLFIATLVNYVDRQALSVAAPVLTKTFHLSERDYAHIVMAFLASYCVMQAIAGRILDWIGVRAGMAWSVFFWSISCMLHALTQGAWSLGLFRFCLGGFEASNYPAGIKAVGDWFPPQERTIATGIFSAGSGLGAILAPPLIVGLILHFGWQAAFIAPGVCGLLWVVPWIWLYRAPAVHPALSDTERDHILAGQAAERAAAAQGGKARWIEILKRREFWGIFVARLLTDPVWWFYIFWLPKYLTSERGFDLAQIAWFAWVPFVGSDIFSIVGGLLPAFFIKRGMGVIKARKVAMVISAAFMPLALFAVKTPTAAAAILFISIATSGHASWTASLLTLPADLFPKNLVASAYGLTAAGGTIGGLLIAAFVGEMLSGFGYGPVFLVIGSLHVIGAVVILTTIRSQPPLPAVMR